MDSRFISISESAKILRVLHFYTTKLLEKIPVAILATIT